MVALMCDCCCQGLYVPNLLLGSSGHVPESREYFNNVLYFSFSPVWEAFISSPPSSPAGRWFSSYLRVSCEFFLPSDQYSNALHIPFPFSSYDCIRIHILKPEYVGVDIGSFLSGYIKGCYDELVFSWSNFTFEKIPEILNLIMDRFNPLFSPNYFYYSDDGYNPNDYAITYTYDE